MRADSAAVSPSAAVGRISVTGNTSVDSTRILRTFEVVTGSRYSDEAVRRGIRKLFLLGLFEDVHVNYQTAGERVDLVIHVRERPRIGSIEFTGQRRREKADLEKKLFLRTGESFSPTALRTQVDSLLKYYREEGFAQASIDAAADTAGEGREVAIRFVVREGERVKIQRVEFPGAQAFPEGKLRKRLKTRARWVLGGGDVKEDQFPEDRQRLELWYRSQGYRDMRVVSQELVPGRAPDRLVLRVAVEEGRLYELGQVGWTGNQVIPTADLERLWPRPAGRYDLSKIERTQGLAYAEYAERGYLYMGVEIRESVRDSIVDVTYAVTEGQPSDIRYVVISGNRNTREKVIRREIDLHEGDRFRRSLLMRSRDDINRLGLFEDVQMDFVSAESTDVDVMFKVKEKQVGTASAGAGFTNESGVTGFLQLGHNNVNGSGQSLSLHLERGGKREDYQLSFTEPWFRDTPTLLGFSAYNSSRDRDFYREKRVGGSGRIGRPLPWPDFSRGSISYELERVTLDSLGTLGAADRVALAGLPFGDRIITSSASVSFLRNSTDNPFYPTRGTRLSAFDEFAGGPFGGTVNFHKHRFEGRIYVPSLVRGVTTMLKARVGLLGEYGDQNRAVPVYERFRLGGGTTPDPLRGYDDYQIVPEKFVRLVAVDTISGLADSILFQRVRYPGGRTMGVLTVEQQFPIVHPLHGVVFFDAGNVWDLWHEIKPLDLKVGAGFGLRMEIPLLGNIGFDYGYGFHRDDGPRAVGHFLLGNVNF